MLSTQLLPAGLKMGRVLYYPNTASLDLRRWKTGKRRNRAFLSCCPSFVFIGGIFVFDRFSALCNQKFFFLLVINNNYKMHSKPRFPAVVRPLEGQCYLSTEIAPVKPHAVSALRKNNLRNLGAA